MNFFDKWASLFFSKDTAGQTVFYPRGWLGKGYTAGAKAGQLHAFVRDWHQRVFVVSAIFGVIMVMFTTSTFEALFIVDRAGGRVFYSPAYMALMLLTPVVFIVYILNWNRRYYTARTAIIADLPVSGHRMTFVDYCGNWANIFSLPVLLAWETFLIWVAFQAPHGGSFTGFLVLLLDVFALVVNSVAIWIKLQGNRPH